MDFLSHVIPRIDELSQTNVALALLNENSKRTTNVQVSSSSSVAAATDRSQQHRNNLNQSDHHQHEEEGPDEQYDVFGLAEGAVDEERHGRQQQPWPEGQGKGVSWIGQGRGVPPPSSSSFSPQRPSFALSASASTNALHALSHPAAVGSVSGGGVHVLAGLHEAHAHNTRSIQSQLALYEEKAEHAQDEADDLRTLLTESRAIEAELKQKCAELEAQTGSSNREGLALNERVQRMRSEREATELRLEDKEIQLRSALEKAKEQESRSSINDAHVWWAYVWHELKRQQIADKDQETFASSVAALNSNDDEGGGLVPCILRPS